MIPLARAPGFEPLRVDDLVELLLARGHRVIALAGGPGSGRTTALRFLATRLPDVDVADGGSVPVHVRHPVVVAIGPRTRTSNDADVVAQLEPWGLDQALDYLARRHPRRCGGVLQRLRAAPDRDLLGGSAELWRAVVVVMLREPRLECVADALRVLLRRDERTPLLRHEGMQVVRSADSVLEDSGELSKRLDFEVVRELARHVRAVSASQRIVETPGAAEEAMATSVLLAHDPSWRPAPGATRSYSHGHFAGARWAEVQLDSVVAIGANFEGADLSDARLDRADLRGATLRRAVLQRASLDRAGLLRADLAGARLDGASLPGAMLQTATLVGASMRGCSLDAANLRAVDARSADLSGSSLVGARLEHALLRGADLRGANATEANLAHADLRDTRLVGACLDRAVLRNARLAGASWPDAQLTGASLDAADLTASRMPGAQLREASLVHARLAGISLPGADLRGADLRGARFHYGSSRSGLVDSVIASEGTRTGYYTSEANELHFQRPAEIRTANLTGADLRGADITNTDFYLVDVRGALYDEEQGRMLRGCGAIVDRD